MKNKYLLFCLISLLLLISCNKDCLLFRVQENGLFGFVDNTGEMIIQPQYKYVSAFSDDGYALIISGICSVDGGKRVRVTYGYIDKNNKLVVDTINQIQLNSANLETWGVSPQAIVDFNNVSLSFRTRLFKDLEVNDGLFIYQDSANNKYGFKSIKGEVVVSAKYFRCNSFTNGFAVVANPYNNIGEVVDDVQDFINCQYVIDKSGKVITPHGYCIVNDFMESKTTWAATYYYSDANERESLGWVKINENGEVIAGPLVWGMDLRIINDENYPVCLFVFPSWFWNGKGFAFIDNSCEFISDFNKDGQVSIRFDGGQSEIFEYVTPFYNNVAGVKMNLWGELPAFVFVNEKFYLVSNLLFDTILPIKEGYSACKTFVPPDEIRDNKWGFVKVVPDKTNDTVYIEDAIPFVYDECGSFKNGLAYFCKRGAAYDIEGYLDYDGKVIWQTERKKKQTE